MNSFPYGPASSASSSSSPNLIELEPVRRNAGARETYVYGDAPAAASSSTTASTRSQTQSADAQVAHFQYAAPSTSYQYPGTQAAAPLVAPTDVPGPVAAPPRRFSNLDELLGSRNSSSQTSHHRPQSANASFYYTGAQPQAMRQARTATTGALPYLGRSANQAEMSPTHHAHAHQPSPNDLSLPSSSRPSLDDKPNARLRCKNCRGFFVTNENGERACDFHPGKFAYKGLYRVYMWSCCRASERSATGCRRSRHVPDPSTLRALETFDRQMREASGELGGARSEQQQQQQEASGRATAGDEAAAQPEEEEEEKKVRDLEKNDDMSQEENSSNGVARGKFVVDGGLKPRQGFLVYQLTNEDTFMGLSLAFGTKIDRLRRANRMRIDDSLYTRKFIYIPDTPRAHAALQRSLESGQNDGKPSERTPEQEALFRRGACRAFVATLRTSMEEAEVYLSENGWDIHRAVDQFRADERWARQNPSGESGQVQILLGVSQKPRPFYPTRA